MQFVVNQKGIKTSVIIPFEEWERINVDYQKLRKKIEVFESITKGVEEIKSHNKRKNKSRTLSEFLNENSN
jgi:proteasome assembly chaperone (PAC2) family protein